MIWGLGLGNPGKEHAHTRHNVGFMVIDELARRHSVSCDKKLLGARCCKLSISDQNVLLAKPQSYMNLSGQPAASLRGYYKLDNSDLVVIHDDLELKFGQVELKLGGGHGGHNGLRDLGQKLGSRDFARIRVGIGRPPKGWQVSDFVLAAFNADERSELPAVLEAASEVFERICSSGVPTTRRRRG